MADKKDKKKDKAGDEEAQKANEKAIREIFLKYDKDSDGNINKSELNTLLNDAFTMAGLTVSQKALQHYESIFDVNGDGQIAQDEFCFILKKYSICIDRA